MENVDAVNAELRAIRDIYDHHAKTDAEARVVAFDSIRVRTMPARPLVAPMPWEKLQPAQRAYAGVGFARTAGAVPHTFAHDYGSFVLYGLLEGEHIAVAGLALSSGAGSTEWLAQLMRDRELILVDWPRCLVVQHSEIDRVIG